MLEVINNKMEELEIEKEALEKEKIVNLVKIIQINAEILYCEHLKKQFFGKIKHNDFIVQNYINNASVVKQINEWPVYDVFHNPNLYVSYYQDMISELEDLSNEYRKEAYTYVFKKKDLEKEKTILENENTKIDSILDKPKTLKKTYSRPA